MEFLVSMHARCVHTTYTRTYVGMQCWVDVGRAYMHLTAAVVTCIHFGNMLVAIGFASPVVQT